MTTQQNQQKLTQTVTTPPPIKKIILHNIQSFPHAEIEPAPPSEMTVLIGASDAGKTALGARSQLKLGFDSYSTKKMIRRGTKKGYISYVYDTMDNLTVSWCFECPVDRATKKPNADKAKTWYEIARDVDGMDNKGNQNREVIKLEGGGKGVPEAIQQITGMKLIQIGKEKINFNVSEQLAGPFMGGKTTPNDRYRILGILAGTLEVDQAVKQVSTEIIQSRREETKLKGEIKSLDEEIAGYDWLEVLGRDIEKVEAAVERMREKRELRDRLVTLQENIKEDLLVIQGANEHIAVLSRWIDNAESIIVDVEVDNHIHQKLTVAHVNIITQKDVHLKAEAILVATNRTTEGQILLSCAEQSQFLAGKLILLAGQIGDVTQKLSASQEVISTTKAVPEISVTLADITGKANKVSILKRLQNDIQREVNKLTIAHDVLTATRTHQGATETITRVSEANHTLASFLLPLKAGISKAWSDILRANETIEVTAGLNEGKVILGNVEVGTSKTKNLRGLNGEISSWAWSLEQAEIALRNTKDIAHGNEILGRVELSRRQKNRLVELQKTIAETSTELNRAQEVAFTEAHNVELATAEYRTLLMDAGICENCPVVDVVLATAG